MALMSATLPSQTSAFVCNQLVSRAIEIFQNPSLAGSDEISLQNLYRLLEMYRFDTFYDVTPRGVLDLRKPGSTVRVNATQGSFLRRALDAAKDAAYPGRDKQTVVRDLEKLIERVAQTANVPGADAQEVKQARAFFENLSRELKAA